MITSSSPSSTTYASSHGWQCGGGPASAGPLVSKISSDDPMALVSNGRKVSPRTNRLSLASTVVMVPDMFPPLRSMIEYIRSLHSAAANRLRQHELRFTRMQAMPHGTFRLLKREGTDERT